MPNNLTVEKKQHIKPNFPLKAIPPTPSSLRPYLPFGNPQTDCHRMNRLPRMDFLRNISLGAVYFDLIY